VAAEAAEATADPLPTTTPPATIAPAETSAPLPANCDAVKKYDWNIQIAYAICMAESRGNAAIDNAGTNRDGSTDYGLMQINSIHAYMVGGNLESLRDPAVNMRVAYSLSHQGTDWTAWSTYNNGKYKQYL
jgi:hypothetical protein